VLWQEIGGARRRIGALPNAGPLSLVRAQRRVKVCPVGKGSPAGTKVWFPAVMGDPFSLEGEKIPGGTGHAGHTFAHAMGQLRQREFVPT
jgi:hypothetical protein